MDSWQKIGKYAFINGSPKPFKLFKQAVHLSYSKKAEFDEPTHQRALLTPFQSGVKLISQTLTCFFVNSFTPWIICERRGWLDAFQSLRSLLILWNALNKIQSKSYFTLDACSDLLSYAQKLDDLGEEENEKKIPTIETNKLNNLVSNRKNRTYLFSNLVDDTKLLFNVTGHTSKQKEYQYHISVSIKTRTKMQVITGGAIILPS